jgi:riboflavin synthase
MFTGIIEQLVEIVSLKNEEGNLDISCKSSITHELKINQSVAHNGVCLTVVDIKGDIYTVTAIKETLNKTNLSGLEVGDIINVERCMKLGDRFDGHIVQGHVDQTAICTRIKEEKGSYLFSFKYKGSENMTVEKGSVCVNGVSLTVVDSEDTLFSVAIIPYTFKHTNFNLVKVGTKVNIEFDILGKYISKMFMRDL